MLGLRIEDLYNSEAEEVAEAIRRLPKKEWEAREIRVRLAHEVHLKQTLLPENLWTTPEEDSQSYIEPYLSEVVQEIEERKDYRAGVPRTCSLHCSRYPHTI